MDALKRFNSKIIKIPNGCWLWKAGTFKDGYGCFTYNGKIQRAHRVSYQLFLGSIPEGLLVCHKCDIRKCVNPDHLFLGTVLDNNLDCIRKNRHGKKGAKGEKHGSAKLTEKQVLEIRQRVNENEITQYKAAKLYGVDPALINGIVHRRIWKHI